MKRLLMMMAMLGLAAALARWLPMPAAPGQVEPAPPVDSTIPPDAVLLPDDIAAAEATTGPAEAATAPALEAATGPSSGPSTLAASRRATFVGREQANAEESPAFQEGYRGRRSRRNNGYSSPSASSTTLSNGFDIFGKRSIFSLEGSPAQTFELGIVHTPPQLPETLVFNGVLSDDPGETTAFIEDTNTDDVMPYKVGDSIAAGKIIKITLDTLEYEADGKVTVVNIGQTLSGETVFGHTPTVAPGTTGGTPGAGPATTQSSGGKSAADILEQMRLRRLKESGG